MNSGRISKRPSARKSTGGARSSIEARKDDKGKGKDNADYARVDSRLRILEKMLDENGMLSLAEKTEMRELYEEAVEMALVRQLGVPRFKQLYPNRSARATAHGTNEHALYAARLLRLQRSWNRESGRPPLLILDWTRLPRAADELEKLKFVRSNEVSEEVQTIVAKLSSSMAHLRCSRACSDCSPSSRPAGDAGCCGVNHIEIKKDGKLVFSSSDEPPEHVHSVAMECSADCGCASEQCTNRDLTVGRKHPLAIFRDAVKGWSVRALCAYDEDAFVTEFMGKVLPGPSPSSRRQVYEIALGPKIPRPHGSPRPFFLSGYSIGNEGRFIAHSCTPNLITENVATDRTALFLTRIGFRASLPIRRGDEVNFDYFVGLGPEEIDVKPFFPYCSCGSPACRFTEEKLKEAAGEEDGDGEDAPRDEPMDVIDLE